MRVCWRWMAILLALGSFAHAGPAPDEKVTLRVKADVGAEARYESSGQIQGDIGGMKLDLQIKQVSRRTVKTVAEDGRVTFESVVESLEQTINGEKLPSEDEKPKPSRITLAPNGAVISIESEEDEEDDGLGARLALATTVVFGEEPVGVGSKWSHRYESDAERGLQAAVAEFKLEAFEEREGVRCARIRMSYRETESKPPLTAESKIWVELTSGDEVATESRLQNISFGEEMAGATLSATLTSRRIGGGRLAKTADGQSQETKAEGPKGSIDEKVKDFEKLPGLFTFYRKKEDQRDRIYMEIREDQLGKLFFLQATASTGTSDRVIAGFPINDIVFRFDRVDKRIRLVRPNLGFRADRSSPMSRAVQRSFSEALLESFAIEAEQEDRKGILIDVSDLFRGDVARVSQLFQTGGLPIPGLGGGSYSQDRQNTYIERLKVFPENVVVETVYAFQGSGGGAGLAALFGLGGETLADERSIVFRVTYNLWELVDTGYRPRLADPRVGYFTTDFQDLTRSEQVSQNVRYIQRWHLVKKDPNAELSEPVEPIVFWIDNATPHEYRDAIREGILEWNKAFERIGFKNAIVVKEMPDDADWDHADMRYNVARWMASPSNAFAIALFRTNPLTGEIVNASLAVDASMLRFTELERSTLVNPARFFAEDEADHGHHHADPLEARRCTYARDAKMVAYGGYLAMKLLGASDAASQRRFVQDFLRNIVCHEMGHVLGLRHNFVASTESTLKQLGDPELVKERGTSASVMDYLPFNTEAVGRTDIPFWSPTIGTYDYWAIEYGYKPIDARTPEGELPELRRIASRCNEPGLAYQTDEAADSFDPYVTTFDLAAEPLEYFERTSEIARRLMASLGARRPQPGRSYWEFTRDFSLILNTHASAMARAVRYIGALRLNNNFRGDPGERPTLEPLDGASQRRALELLNRNLFAPNAFPIPREYLVRFAPDPDASFADLLAGPNDFPIRDQLASLQTAALRRLFSPSTLRRVANNEFKVGRSRDAFTLAELFSSVRDNVWAELGRPGEFDPLRRDLQRAHLDLLVEMVVQVPARVPQDAVMLAWNELEVLKKRIERAREKATGTYTPIFLDECLKRIERALDAEQTIGAPARPPASLLEELLGTGRPAPRRR